MISGYAYHQESGQNQLEISTQIPITDCPDEKIVNCFPGSPYTAYYKYHGELYNIDEFDSAYVATYCNLKVTMYH